MSTEAAQACIDSHEVCSFSDVWSGLTHHLLAAENMFECSDDKNLRAGTDGTGDGTNAADCDKRVMTIKLPIRECGRCMHIPNALAPILLLPFLFVPAGAHIKILISGHYAEDLEILMGRNSVTRQRQLMTLRRLRQFSTFSTVRQHVGPHARKRTGGTRVRARQHERRGHRND